MNELNTKENNNQWAKLTRYESLLRSSSWINTDKCDVLAFRSSSVKAGSIQSIKLYFNWNMSRREMNVRGDSISMVMSSNISLTDLVNEWKLMSYRTYNYRLILVLIRVHIFAEVHWQQPLN